MQMSAIMSSCALRSSLRLLSPLAPPPPPPTLFLLHLHRPLLIAAALPSTNATAAAEKGGRSKWGMDISQTMVARLKENWFNPSRMLLLDLLHCTPGSPGLQLRAISGSSAHISEPNGGGGSGSSGGGGGGSGDRGGGGSSGNAGESQKLGLFAWYLKMLERHPVKAKALTSALLTFFGDLFCQFIVEKSDSINLKRIGVISVLGLLLVGPTLHFWYLALSKIVLAGGTKGAGMRLLLDQFIFAPVFIAVFFTALLTLEGRPSDIIPKLNQDWRSAVIANWKTWIPFQFLNFLFVPQQLQVGAANLIALGWNVYLSFATHTDVSQLNVSQPRNEESKLQES